MSQTQTQSVALLDTPKKKSLQVQSIRLRVALKEFERTFANTHAGRKPSKDDIKLDTDIAGKYKEYNRLRDVLAGKLEYEAFLAPPPSPVTRKSNVKVADGRGQTTVQRDTIWATPRKSRKSVEDGSLEEPHTATPKPFYPITIGPTPQRDGRALGLFDMLSNSAGSTQMTPSSGRKRKLEDYIEIEGGARNDAVTQTPSGRRSRTTGDLLDHLTGEYIATPETGHRRYGRTPVSEGRKFMLSQFFATPSTDRFSDMTTDAVEKQPIPPTAENQLDQATPKQNPIPEALDATPAYLKRASSFKDRLLSVSSPNLGGDPFRRPSPPPSFINGPPTLRHFKSITRSSSQMLSEPPSHQERSDDESDEDELEALREIESNSVVRTLIKDSQTASHYELHDEQYPSEGSGRADNHFDEEGNSIARPDDNQTNQPTKPWKKKGQKRTTKRARIRPGQAPLPAAPKFVLAEDPDSDFPSENSDNDHNGDDETAKSDRVKFKKKAKKIANNNTKMNTKAKDKTSTSTSTINPNAQSHMNFRSLKIRNKNSKAGGRARFGGRRR